MNDDQTERLLSLLGNIAASLERLSAGEQDPEAVPEWIVPIESFPVFDWHAHTCTVLATDDAGPTLVQWNGKTFKRRSPENAYDPAIWFSRCVGKDAEGRNEYARLITFKQYKENDIQPLSRKAEKIITAAPKPTPPPTPPPAAEAPKQEPPPSAPGRTDTDAELAAAFDALQSASATVAARAAAAREQAQASTSAPAKTRPAAGIAGIAAEFRGWADGFVVRFPAYRTSASDPTPDLFRLLKIVGSWNVRQVDANNMAEVCARLEAHAREGGEGK